MSNHYELSPSGMSRILACPGSLNLPQVDVETHYASEGTAAHDVLAKGIETGEPDCSELEEDAADAVREAFNYVQSIKQDYFILDQRIEETVESDEIPGLGGTPDLVLLYLDNDDEQSSVLHVIDYKHGKGVPVSVEDNKQLLSYLLILSHADRNIVIDRYRMTIIQPRAINHDSVQTIDVTREQLKQHESDIFAAIEDGKTLKTGGHCQFCNSAAFCPALRKTMLLAAKEEFSNEDLMELYRMTSVIRKTLDTIPKILIKKIKGGEKIEGLKVVQSLSNRKWNADFVEALGENAEKIKRPVDYMSPAQAEKVLGKGVVADLTHRDETGEKLVAGSHDFCSEFKD